VLTKIEADQRRQDNINKIFLKKLGLRIRTIRKSKGFSQLDIGVAMDNYAEQVGRIERGQINVTICTLKNIAHSLDITLSELLNFDET
jgi:transcriptional regulator with XRE-family HTH domain